MENNNGFSASEQPAVLIKDFATDGNFSDFSLNSFQLNKIVFKITSIKDIGILRFFPVSSMTPVVFLLKFLFPVSQSARA